MRRMDVDKLIEQWYEFFRSTHQSGRNYSSDIKYLIEFPGGPPQSVYIEFEDVNTYDASLTKYVLEDYDLTMMCAHRAIERWATGDPLEHIKLRIHHVPEVYEMAPGNLQSYDIGKFARFRGNITAADLVQDEITTAAYECLKCHVMLQVPVSDFDTITPPRMCQKDDVGGCGKTSFQTSFELHTELSKNTSVQFFQLEEHQTPGMERQPVEIMCYASGDIASVWVQDDVIINGVVKSAHKRKGGSHEKRGTIYIDVVSIEMQKALDLTLKPEEKDWIHELVQRPDYVELLDMIICPRLKGLVYEKRAVWFCAFGGRSFPYEEGGGVRQFRKGNFHVAIYGDKSTGKSVLARWIVMVSPIARFHNCLNNKVTGLTYGTYKNEMTGKTRIRQGVVAMANNGLAAIDELDKAPTEQQEALHEPLDDQVITIGKGDVQRGVLMARTAVIVLGNPKHGSVSETVDAFDQFDISPSLHSRFACTYLVKEIVNEEHDDQVIPHLIHQSANPKKAKKAENETLPDPRTCTEVPTYMIKKWLNYARKEFNPEVTPEIEDYLVRASKSIRATGYPNKRATITFRQITDMILVSEAVARSRLHQVVEKDDCKIAIEILMECYGRLLKDGNGILDPELLYCGVHEDQKERLLKLKESIELLTSHYPSGVPMEKLREIAEQKGVSEELLQGDIRRLLREKVITEMRPGFFKREGA